MSNNWSLVPIGQISERIERPEVPKPGVIYRQVGVRLWGQGAYERDSIDGIETSYKTLSRVEANDIVVNKIWARNGSVAVITPRLAGCFVSTEFPQFVPDLERLEPRWFHWLTKTSGFWQQCDEKSHGTSGKNRIRPEKFLEIQIPLPPLDEQRRIVARIEELATKGEQAQQLRRQSVAEVEGVWQGALAKAFSPVSEISMRLEGACEAIIDNLHSTPKYDGDEFPCLRSQDVGWGTIDYTTARRTSEEEFIHRTRRGEPQAGDIVYVREGDIGRCGLVDGSHRFSLGQRVMMFRPNQKIVDPKFLTFQLMSPPVLKEQVLEKMTGTTSKHVNIKYLRKVQVIISPLSEQRRIVAYLDGLQAKVEAVKRHQAVTAAKLDALLPSILDKAFKGEL
jgi:type I restriction enzyme S subunit